MTANKQSKWKDVGLVAFGGTLGVLCFCALVLILVVIGEPSRYVQISSRSSIFSFDAKEIQRQLDAGKMDTFKLLWQEQTVYTQTNRPSAVPTPIATETYPYPRWTEAMFERVVLAFLRTTDYSLPANSHLYNIWFQLPCRFADQGMESMRFHYFAEAPSGFAVLNTTIRERYMDAMVNVNLATQRVWLIQQVFSEVQNTEHTLDRSGGYVQAERALNIAEQAGGQTYPNRLDPACGVFGFAKAGIRNGSWNIEYQKRYDWFEIEIDNRNGGVKILKTPPPKSN